MRIGTWNLENLFRPGPSGPSTDAAYQAKLDVLAETITGLAPDVLAVQEVGDPDALADLAAKLTGYTHLETAAPDGRGIRVGFVSKLPLTQVNQVTAFPTGLHPIQVDDTTKGVSTMGRAALHVRVGGPGGTPVDVLTCHLKSKLLTFPGGKFSTTDEGLRARFAAYALYRRTAEAVTVRASASTLLGGDGRHHKVVVLGDLNDEPEAATTQILLGPPGSELGTTGFAHQDQGDGARLWNLATLIDPAERYSRVNRGRRELIDHIMVSHAIVTGLSAGAVTAGPASGSVTGDPKQRRDTAGSDHRPLALTFED